MNRKQNNAYMLRQWILPGIVGVLAALFAGSQVLQGNVLPVVIVAALVAVTSGWSVWRGSKRRRKLLQTAAPEPLLAYFDRSIGQAPIADRDASLAFTRALVNTLYGRFDAARADVNKIDWAARPALIQAQRIILQAWWAYLDQSDFARGLALAEQARQLADVSLVFPGAGLAVSTYDAAIEMGQLFTGSGGPGEAERLEARLRRQPLLPRALLAWGLLLHYQRAGEASAAERLRELLAKIAPHCPGLSTTPKI